jgi:hypothetical protein
MSPSTGEAKEQKLQAINGPAEQRQLPAHRAMRSANLDGERCRRLAGAPCACSVRLRGEGDDRLRRGMAQGAVHCAADDDALLNLVRNLPPGDRRSTLTSRTGGVEKVKNVLAPLVRQADDVGIVLLDEPHTHETAGRRGQLVAIHGAAVGAVRTALSGTGRPTHNGREGSAFPGMGRLSSGSEVPRSGRTRVSLRRLTSFRRRAVGLQRPSSSGPCRAAPQGPLRKFPSPPLWHSPHPLGVQTCPLAPARCNGSVTSH